MQANNTPTLGNAETTHTIDRASGIGPAAPVLADHFFLKVKTNFFILQKASNKQSASVILGLIKL